MDIKFVKRDTLKEKPDQSNLGFGKYMTDYMFVMDWDKGVGWHYNCLVCLSICLSVCRHVSSVSPCSLSP